MEEGKELERIQLQGTEEKKRQRVKEAKGKHVYMEGRNS